MKINVEGIAPRFKDRIIEIVEGIDTLKCIYLPKENTMPTTLVFEVEGEDLDDSIDIMKGAIKKSDIGRIINFRVIPSGELYYFRKAKK